MPKRKIPQTYFSKLAVFKQPLAEQAAQAIRLAAQQEKWLGFLPGEHHLSTYLGISRSTLREALDLLVGQGFLSKSKGKRTRIVARFGRLRAKASEGEGIVRLLTPQNIDEFTPFMFRWYLKYRALMRSLGVDLQLSYTSGLFTRFSRKQMEQHVKALPAKLWLLHVSPRFMQSWFLENHIPFILAGTPHPQIKTAFVDADQKASARHATGLLLAAGHHSMAMLVSANKFAGDFLCIEGMQSAIAASPICGRIRHEILEYDETSDNLVRILINRFRQADRPTALVVCHQWVLPGVLCALNRLGIKWPHDISLICLQAAPFMHYISPRLCHYSTNADLFANKLADLSRRFLKTGRLPCSAQLIVPTFVPGESIVPPPN